MTRMDEILYELGPNFPEGASRTELVLAWAVRWLAEQCKEQSEAIYVLEREIQERSG